MSRKSQEPLTIVSGSAPTLADPPATLREAGATLWRSIMAEYAVSDSGGRAILEQACASADRAAECASIIAEQGAVISTKHGLKDHPLLRHETAARGLVGRLLTRLGLDVEPLRPTAGRPGSGVGWVPPR
jgi:Phage terminase, small subunit